VPPSTPRIRRAGTHGTRGNIKTSR
jgi:hypothetical protein